MTGNLTNATQTVMEILSKRGWVMAADARRLTGSLALAAGFLIGCLAAAAAVSVLADWAWSLPLALATVAVVLH
jgi:uncharacterized membrane protein YoaK (UPF0700 family)